MSRSILSTKHQLASIWELGGLTVFQVAQRVWKQVDDDDLLNRAAELAYNFLLSIFPLLLFLLSLLGMFASQASVLRYQLFASLEQFVPDSAFNLISRTVNEVVAGSGGGKLTFGLLFFLWSATGGFTTVIAVLNAAYHVHDSRPWYKVRIIATALTLAVTVLMVVALAIALFGGQIAGFIGAKIGLSTVLLMTWKTAQWFLALFFMSFAFALLYYYGPDVKEQHWYWITPGSLTGVVLWVASTFGLRLYLHYFNNYSKTYGSLGGVMILLLWFYLTGLAFLIGGEINAIIEHAAAEQGHVEAKPIGKKAA